jgi:undecaprenyl diphosphate synthase
MLKSIAIIPDGNRRFARKKKLSLEEVYRKSIDKIFDIVKWCKEFNIKTLTLWGFSTENWKRSKIERKILFRLFEEKAREVLRDERINKEGIKIRIIGEISKFPKRLEELFREVERKTKKNKKIILNILLNYGGRKEIIAAVNKILLKKKKKISEEEFKKYLWLKDEPDLIIRTSGEMRLSGFLSFQSAYSELYFVKKYFPELTKNDFKKIVENFKKRERRFGR